MPKRVTYEFQCTGSCQKFFDIKLSTSLSGNFRIVCPACGHVHYREVKEGKITGVRWPENNCPIRFDDIVPMKSSCRDYRKEVAEDSDFEQSPKGFMHRLWKERFGARA